MIEAHLAKLRARDRVDSAEEAAIREAVSETRTVPDGRTFIRRGEKLAVSTLLLDGWMARARDLRAGHRQITELHVSGDFVDLHSFTLKHLDHDIITLAPCKIAIVPHENLRRITEQFPHLTRLLWLMTDIDAAIHREWAVSLARRRAASRLAHLLCELQSRLEVVGCGEALAFNFPLTQAEIAECLGLTSVHMNRTFQELRRLQLITFENRQIRILDLPALRQLGEFDPMYLYLNCEAR